MYCLWKTSYQERRVGIPSSGLYPPFIVTCLKPVPGFSTSYVVVCFMFSELRWDMISRFVDIGWIDDHQYLSFLFIVWLGQKP